MKQRRPYQGEALDALFNYFASGGVGNPLVALPTGTGKSYVISDFIRTVLHLYPTQRILVLTHVRELIRQNTDELTEMWPHAPFGIYSAGLGRKDYMQPIIFGGIASVNRALELFPAFDLMLIDEAHLLAPSDNTMYQKCIKHFKQLNPWLKVLGFTATPFRLKQGMLTDDGLFTDIVYNLCDIAGFEMLINEGYIVPPIPRYTQTELDTSNVRIQAGEFNLNQLQIAVDKPDVTYAACREIAEQGYYRKKWLIFCSGVEHAENVAEILNGFGIPTAAVHDKLSTARRDEILAAHKRGELRAVTNNNILTTGYNDPEIDLIGMLRPTCSPGLWVQMLGRGTRPVFFPGFDLHTAHGRLQSIRAGGKLNCLVLDFARNALRLGPIDDPRIPGKPGKCDGDLPVKICEQCGAYNHPRVKYCIQCGAEFEFRQKLVRVSGDTPFLSTKVAEIKSVDVDHVFYYRHIAKESKKLNIRVVYHCGMQTFTEFVCFDTDGYRRRRAEDWWSMRHASPPPMSTDAAMSYVSELRVPRKVKVLMNVKYPEVLDVEW